MGRVFACSDLHGMYNLYKDMCDFLEPDDKVFCLGDCGDRGYDSWKLIKEVLGNPQFIYLKGNHEYLLTEAYRNKKSDEYWILVENGGFDTLKGLQKEEDAEQWCERLESLKSIAAYTNKEGKIILLSHAGFTPGTRKEWNPLSSEFLWNREHYKDSIPYPLKDFMVVHGHTPVQCMREDDIESSKDYEEDVLSAFWYCDNQKVDIDMGSFVSGKAILLDLDTFEEYSFYDIFKVPLPEPPKQEEVEPELEQKPEILEEGKGA